MENQYEAVTKEELIARLGKQCSPHSTAGGYVIGPDATGRICHVASCHSIGQAIITARDYNEKHNK